MKLISLAYIFVMVGVALCNDVQADEGEKCGENEHLADFPPTCPNDSCDQAIMNPGHCVLAPRLPLRPKKTCRCNDGYFRVGNNGPCVPFSQCPAKTCPPNEHLEKCPPTFCFEGQFCPNGPKSKMYCDQPRDCSRNSTATIPQCQCDFNYRRERRFGSCIPITKCPPFQCNGANEEYDACSSADNTCKEYISAISGRQSKILPVFNIVLECKPSCRCMDGFYRNSNNTCVHASACV